VQPIESCNLTELPPGPVESFQTRPVQPAKYQAEPLVLDPFLTAHPLTRVVIGGRGPHIEFLPGHLIWDNLHMLDEERYRTEHSWKDNVFYVEWRTKDQSSVKVYDQKRTVDYADYKVGLFYISPFDLSIGGEPVVMKLKQRAKPLDDVKNLSKEEPRRIAEELISSVFIIPLPCFLVA
jgi:hypothetical protein